MRWIKASEQVPDHYRSVYVRYTLDGIKRAWTARYNPSAGQWVSQGAESLIESPDLEWLDEESPDDMTTAFQNEPVNFLLSNALRHLTQDQQRQLCNALQERLPIPASLEQEAERLYPYPECALADERHYIDKQRSAHITCARQYMGEIERMGKLCMEKDGQIEALQNEIEKLRAENSKMAEAVEILTELCALKKYKDSVGKDSHYEQEQPKAWKRANEFLNRLATEALK